MPTGSFSGSIILMISKISKELLPSLLGFFNTIIIITRRPQGPFTSRHDRMSPVSAADFYLQGL